MFDTLIVSRPRATNAWRRELGGPTFSLVAHSLILYAAVTATASSDAGTPVRVSDSIMIYEPPPDRTPPEPQTPSLSKVFRTLVPPASIPRSIPPIDPNQTFDPGDYTGTGFQLQPLGDPGRPVDPAQVYITAVVDEPPLSISFPQPEYPRMLLEARIEGSVVLEAIIDTLGHPEPGSIRVVSSTNRGFEAAARAAFRRALFRAGRVQGQKVRVLVHQPLKFTLP